MQANEINISNIIEKHRMDASFFITESSYKGYVSLSKYVSVKGGKRIPKGESFSSQRTDYLYLRLSDIDNFEIINFKKFNSISEDLFNKLHRYQIKENELIISIAGTIGKTFNIKNIPIGKKVILTENCAKLIIKDSNVLPEYLRIVLESEVIQEQISANRIKTTIPKIGLDRIGRLKLPTIPPVDVQRQIVEQYTQAQEAKLTKDKAAKSLLDSIDIYLLEVLDIEPLRNHTFDKIIIKNISAIIGNRLDVSFYKERFEMMSRIYPNKKLSSVVEIDPAIKFSQDPNTEISFVPMECIDEKYGEIFDARTTVISKAKGYTKFEEGDLLWAKITPCMQNGKSAIVKNLKNGVGCGSTEYYVMRPKNSDVLIEYVYMILRHKGVLEAAQNSFGGSAGQQRVSRQYLNSIMIPLPPLEKQQEIVKNINKMKQHAKQLQEEGIKLLEDIKHEIEQIISGSL